MDNSRRETDAALFYGIGLRYKGACLAKLDFPSEVNELILDWMKKDTGMLIFESNPGTGKTYLAAALCNLWHPQQKWIRYFTAESYLEKMRNAISMNHDAMALIDDICECHYLILDDLGSNLANTDWQRSVMFKTIDSRYVSKLPTVILTNLDRADISNLYTERTASRMYASENVYIKLKAEDKRKEGM